jgi:hypothetical protein
MGNQDSFADDILSEIKATKEAVAQAREAVSVKNDAQASFSSNLRKLLAQAKNNPDMLRNIPDENIHNLENHLEGLISLNESGAIQAQEQITDLEEFLALYNKSHKS